MAKGSNSTWLVVALVIAGAVLFVLSTQNKNELSKSVELKDVFHQEPQAQGKSPSAPKDPVVSPAIVTNPENGQEAGFAVQVYSFQDRTRAEKALDNLKKLGYKAFTEVSDLGDKGTWYRVRIGGLDSEAQAKAMLDEVRKKFNSGYIVKSK